MIPFGWSSIARTGLIAFALLTSQSAFSERPQRTPQSREALLAEVKALHGARRYHEQRLLIIFKAGTSDADKERIARELRGTHRRLHHGGPRKTGRELQVVEFGRSYSVASAIAKVMHDPVIEEISPDWTVELQENGPNDPGYANEWGLQGPDSVAPHPFGIGLAELWSRGYTCSSSNPVVVAILDTGVRMSHEDLRDQIFTNPGEIAGDGVDNDGNGFVDDLHGWNFVDKSANADDVHSHGSHIAGIIAARKNNGRGITGVCGDGGVKILPLRVCTPTGGCTTSDILAAMAYMTDLKLNRGVNLRVANISLGIGSNGPNYFGIEHFQAARDAGILIAVSAANNSANLDNYFVWPTSLGVENIVVVGNYTRSASYASNSNYGVSVDIAAPGSDIYSAIIGSDQAYGWKSGTSMAAPHVAGALAQYFVDHPDATASEAKAALLNTASQEPWLVGKVAGARRLNLANWDGQAKNLVVRTKCGQGMTRRTGFWISANVSIAPGQPLANTPVTMKAFRPNGSLFQSFTGMTNADGGLVWMFANASEPLDRDFLLRVQTADGAGKTFTNAELNCQFQS
jgi:serine protease